MLDATNCLICSRPRSENSLIPIPGHYKLLGYLHPECLRAKVLELSRDLELRAILTQIVSYEETHKSEFARRLSQGISDSCWGKELGHSYHKINKLLSEKIVTVLYQSNKNRELCLVNREITKRALEDLTKMQPSYDSEPLEELSIPDDLFSIIIGYQDIKELITSSLKADMPLFRSFLFIGPPHSGKTLFLLEIERIKGTYWVTGESGATRIGLREVIMDIKPKILCIDEIDKLNSRDREVLLSPTDEHRRISVTKHGDHRLETTNIKIFAAANPPKSKFSPQFLDRFWVFEFQEYSREEFLEISRRMLTRKGIEESLAEKISTNVWSLTKSLRDSVRVAEAVKSGVKLETCIDILGKYRR